MSVLSELRKAYALDPRSLALFRIGLGVVLLLDIGLRLQDYGVFYTDAGLVPHEVMRAAQVGTGRWSIHLWNGAAWWSGALLFAQAVAALCLLLGVQTRKAALVCWVLLVSLHGRNPLILQAGDALLRLVLLWALWLPLDRVWALRPRPCPPPIVEGIGTAGLTLQVAGMYICTVLLKSGEAWHREASAVHYALSIDPLVTPVGQWVLSLGPDVSRALTRAAYGIELLLPVLLLVPLRARLCRAMALVIGIPFHLALGATLHLGLFPLTDVVALLPFLPSVLWGASAAPVAAARRTGAAAKALWAGCGCVIIALTAWLCLRSVCPVPRPPAPLRWLSMALYLDQKWSMFAPFPMIYGGWYEVTGKAPDGTRVNLLHPERAPDLVTRPPDRPWYYRNQRWVKYMLNMSRRKKDNPQAVAFAEYLCRRWTQALPGRQLESVSVYFVRWRTPSLDGKGGLVSRVRQHVHRCGQSADTVPGRALV